MAALLVLAACGPSGQRYLANRDEKVFLRVPTSWHDVKLSDEHPNSLLQATMALVVGAAGAVQDVRAMHF